MDVSRRWDLIRPPPISGACLLPGPPGQQNGICRGRRGKKRHLHMGTNEPAASIGQ